MTATRQLDLVVPGSLSTRTGGYVYDRRMLDQLRARGFAVSVHEIGDGYPRPCAAARQRSAATMARIPAGRTVVIDGLALGGMADIAERERARLTLIGLIHHPLALETGLSVPDARGLFHAERRALAAVARVIVTSETTASALAEYGVGRERIDVVRPGTDPAPLSRGAGATGLRLLCVATLTPRKGHDVVVEALAGLTDRPWRLRCAGSRDRDPATARHVRARIAAGGLGDRIALLGELDDDALGREYAHADAFVLASMYEGYGMALAEALARGLPVIATTGGAVPETVPANAGLLVPPGDAPSLEHALGRLMDDPSLRARLRAGAREARAKLSSWDEAGAAFAAAVTGARR